jgi:O-antigen/teichoic acid export membrane protein
MQSVVAKNFLVYASGALLLRSLSVVTAPITMAVLAPAEYGMLSLLHGGVMVLAIMVGLGLRQVFLLEYFHCTPEKAQQLVNDLLVLYLAIATPLMLLLARAIPTLLVSCAVVPSAYIYGMVTLALLLIFCTFFVELFNQLVQYQAYARFLVLLQTLVAIVAAAVQVALLCWVHLGVASIFAAQLFAFLCTIAVAGYGYWKMGYGLQFNLRRSLANSWHYLALGLPFVPSMTANWLMTSGNRFVVAYFISLHDVGIYAVADTFGQLFNVLVVKALESAYIPILLRSFTAPGADHTRIESFNQKIMYACMLFGAVVITIGCFFSKPLLALVVPASYYEALNYLWFLLIGYLFFMGATFVSGLLQWQKKVTILSSSLIIAALAQLLLSMFLVPRYALYGSVIASMLSYMLYFAGILWYNKRLQKKLLRENG